MERWFYVETLEKAVIIYEEQIDYLNKLPENINLKEYLLKDGFRYA